MTMPLSHRASHCRICQAFIPVSDEDLEKLARIEAGGGCQILFLCEACNDAFVAAYSTITGEAPIPVFVSDRPTMH